MTRSDAAAQVISLVPELEPPDPAQFQDEAALYKAYADYTRNAVVLPRNGVPEMEFRMHIAASVYNIIAKALKDAPADLAADKIRLMQQYLDPRLVFFAVRWYQRDLLPLVKVPCPVHNAKPVENIGIFCHYLRNGGAERCAALLANDFVLAGKRVTLFASEPATELDYPLPEEAERVVLDKLPHERRAQLEIELEARKIDTCVFIDHAEWRTANDILSAQAAGARIIAMEHSFYSYPWAIGQPSVSTERDIVYRAADLITVLSRPDREMWHANGFKQAVYVPNPPTFEADKITVHGDLTAETMIFVGRLTAQKGAEKALEVLRAVRRKHPNAKLLMVGRSYSADYDKQLQDKVREYGLADAVVFTGQTADVGQYYRKSSVLIMPSELEGFPMTLMEAKVYGIPAVLFSMPYLEAAHAGCIQTPQGDAQAMAEAVSRLFDDPETLKRLGGEARDSLNEFSGRNVRLYWQKMFGYLEGKVSAEEMFAVGESTEERCSLLMTSVRELHKWQDKCLSMPAFLDGIGGRIRESYLSGHPVMQIMDRLCRRMPGLIGRFNSLFRKIFRRSMLKSVYRGSREVELGPNGFPPYD